MKTMQTAGRGKASSLLLTWQDTQTTDADVEERREYMRHCFREARFEVKALRAAKPYRTPLARMEYAAGMQVLHDLARAALRSLNALKAEVTP